MKDLSYDYYLTNLFHFFSSNRTYSKSRLSQLSRSKSRGNPFTNSTSISTNDLRLYDGSTLSMFEVIN